MSDVYHFAHYYKNNLTDKLKHNQKGMKIQNMMLMSLFLSKQRIKDKIKQKTQFNKGVSWHSF